jgi:hypothetical protein
MFVENVATGQSVVMTHITTAGISVALIQWLKGSKYFPWITAEKGKLLRVLAAVTSAIGAVGIGYTWHPDARQLVFTIPTLAAMFAMGAAWAKSFIMQEIVYQGTVKNPVADLIRELQSQGILPTPPGGNLIAGKVFPSPVSSKALGTPNVGTPNVSRCGLLLKKWKTPMHWTLHARRSVDPRKLFPAMAVCLAIFAGMVVLLFAGCAVRHNANGTTTPATRFEQIMAYNTAIAQANDGFADNVIGLQSSGDVSKESAKSILTMQARIARADKSITGILKSAANCGLANAGSSATLAQVSDASALCAKSYGAELQNAVNLILDSLAQLNNGLLLGVKTDQKRFGLAQALASVQNLAQQILGALREYSVIARLEASREVYAWRRS